MTLSKHLVPKPWGLENRDDLPFSPTKRNKKLNRILPKNFKFELKNIFHLDQGVLQSPARNVPKSIFQTIY
jgi:hypothetical protein